mmetsp:Transcript_14510/g.29040  ORF Transcript_14510/g.29040 Transcript_14510/m.29040 type:complete len:110 (-) Transcript_14510:245-574(-)
MLDTRFRSADHQDEMAGSQLIRSRVRYATTCRGDVLDGDAARANERGCGGGGGGGRLVLAGGGAEASSSLMQLSEFPDKELVSSVTEGDRVPSEGVEVPKKLFKRGALP